MPGHNKPKSPKVAANHRLTARSKLNLEGSMKVNKGSSLHKKNHPDQYPCVKTKSRGDTILAAILDVVLGLVGGGSSDNKPEA